jgi:arylformamidase
MSQRIVDLSFGLERDTPVFDNYPHVEITILDASDRPPPPRRRSLNSSHLAMGLHCGTHMDAPFHFMAQGNRIDQVPLERCVGPAVLLHLPDHGPGALIEPDHLISQGDALRETRRLVLNTGWHHRWGRPGFFTEHPVLTVETGQFLVECGVQLVGVDFPSVDYPPNDTHVVLLGNDILIVENLTNLDAIGSDRFELVTLPLKIVGRDGSPVRAIGLVG